MNSKDYKIKFGGREFLVSYGKLAAQADGAVTVTYGETTVLATVVVGNEPREGVDFFPLLVDYEERLYAAGKISGSRFIKREGRPSEEAVLTCRLIDRPIRPLFPKNFKNDVQIIITVLSVDKENDPDIVALNAASIALIMSGAPFNGPIGAVRIGYIDEKFVVNPTQTELEDSKLDLIVAATKEKVMMIEAGANEVKEDVIKDALKVAKENIQDIINLQEKIAQEIKKDKKDHIVDETSEISQDVHKFAYDEVKKMMKVKKEDERRTRLDDFLTEVLKNFEGNYKQNELKTEFDKLIQKSIREAILENNDRPDGRSLTDIRPIDVEVGLFPRTHGSGLFTRGQTQALTVATLAGPGMQQMIDTMSEEGEKRYMHHYNFPPYSTGEVRPMRGAGRREIGHGALAERALLPVLPSKEEFPYTIRLVSEILSSNGSSSMAATCGSTLALMDAGVPIKKPVSGIAMGLITSKDGKEFKVLTDLQGLEDFGGDMDFKIAGTADGITAIQMDTKINGLSEEIIEQTFKQALVGRLEILKKMEAVIAAPRKELSPYAPRIITVKIDPEKIGELIGPGGKTINKIIEDCGGKENITIDIEEDGTIAIASIEPEHANKAKEIIEGLTEELEVGKIYDGTVINIQKDRRSGTEIGAIVEVGPNKEGMVHISEIKEERINKVSDYVKPGDKVKVKVMIVDKERGRVGLSIKRAK